MTLLRRHPAVPSCSPATGQPTQGFSAPPTVLNSPLLPSPDRRVAVGAVVRRSTYEQGRSRAPRRAIRSLNPQSTGRAHLSRCAGALRLRGARRPGWSWTPRGRRGPCYCWLGQGAALRAPPRRECGHHHSPPACSAAPRSHLLGCRIVSSHRATE